MEEEKEGRAAVEAEGEAGTVKREEEEEDAIDAVGERSEEDFGLDKPLERADEEAARFRVGRDDAEEVDSASLEAADACRMADDGLVDAAEDAGLVAAPFPRDRSLAERDGGKSSSSSLLLSSRALRWREE